MKRTIKILAVIMIVSIVGFCAAFVFTGFNLDAFPHVFYTLEDDDYTKVTQTVANPNGKSGIRVSTKHERVIIDSHNEDEIVITYFESDYKTTTFSEEGEIKLSTSYKRKFYFRPSFLSKEFDYMKITIPQSFSGFINLSVNSHSVSVTAKNTFESVKITNSSGSVSVDGITSLGEGIIKNNSGSITIKNSNFASDAQIKNSSSRIEIKNSSFQNTNITQSSGSVKIFDTDFEDLTLKNNSGRIVIEDTIANKMELSNNSGRIELDSVISERIYAKNSSGGIYVTGIFDSAEFKTSSGRIELDIACPYLVATNSSGRIEIEIKGRASEYEMDLKTSSGNIRIDGKKVSDTYSASTTHGNYMYVRNSSGNITIDFD